MGGHCRFSPRLAREQKRSGWSDVSLGSEKLPEGWPQGGGWMSEQGRHLSALPHNPQDLYVSEISR